MTASWKAPEPSPFDDVPGPSNLTAQVVERHAVGARIHGYDVYNDVSVNYRHSDQIYLGIVGELPTDDSSRLFHAAVCSLSVVSINEAPAHAGHLARLCGGAVAAALSVAAVSAADIAQEIVSEHRPLLDWLSTDLTTHAPAYERSDEVQALLEGLSVPAAISTLSLRAAQVALLYLAGVRSEDHLTAVIMWAVFSGAMSEVVATKPYQLQAYPALLPPFHYVSPGRP